MDIDNFVKQLEMIINEIEEKVNKIENNTNAGIKAMPELIGSIQNILPDWFYFIEQTDIGSKEMIVTVLNDIALAMNNEDSILLVDALIFGMQELMLEYRNVIKEALA